MTAMELYETAEERPRRSSIVNHLLKLATGFTNWRLRRHTLLKLASFDAYQLADIGIDPDDVQDALHGDASRFWARIAARNARR